MPDFNEAPASVTYTIQTKNGFNCLYTLRELTGQDLLDKMERCEADFAKRGIVPQPIKKFGGANKEVEYIPDQKCPTCGGRLVRGQGKVKAKCENNKWNALLKRPEGCPYIQWVEDMPRSV